MPVHGRTDIATAGAPATLAELVLITKRERIRARECAVSARGVLAQRRTLVVAGLGGVRAIAGTDVPGAAGADVIWTRDGAGGDHPCVGRSRADITDGGAAGAVSAGRYFDSPLYQSCLFSSLSVFHFPGSPLFPLPSLFHIYIFISYPFAAHMNGVF